MNEIKLDREDISRITQIIEKFPEISRFDIIQERCSGIGYVTTLVFDYSINDVLTKVQVEINGVESW